MGSTISPFMHIAFLSYEYPPDSAIGGIGTYTAQMANALAQDGYHVEVFCSSPTRQCLNEQIAPGLTVHRIKTIKRETFRQLVLPVLTARHTKNKFHLIESPEYGAEGVGVKKALPDTPLIVRFHTPSFLVNHINSSLKEQRLTYKIKRSFRFDSYKMQRDAEYKLTIEADALVSPGKSLAGIIAAQWAIPLSAIAVIPNPFIPDLSFLQIPVDTHTDCVTYMGRLEGRKGVHLLADVIPIVLAAVPGARFRFIGKSDYGPGGKGSMLHFLKEKLAAQVNSIEFINHVSSSEVPLWLAKTDICVFPSLWENFPYVCLEAMSAGRGIVASENGGMYDMLHDIGAGQLVDPYHAAETAAAIIDLLRHPRKRKALGEKNRKKIIAYYSDEVVQLNKKYYNLVIDTFRKQLHTS